ncbi:adenylyl-sulfate kinase [Saccharomonospora cyanea]|uniref:Adenylyl-sulfate kinase n=1 Tax=Saccharomonospora cyanea NA-134 TaxID=882082 RepID=H5XCN5_9PSEU|nr:adenylyl-sulfate kinase [Saccharomonospora cyanea]EHR61281.1 adenylylsulfate kinase ApsK [Saccharomonospora cyanea NA-134]
MSPMPAVALETGATVWLTGLSGAGKSTVARTIADAVRTNVEVGVLDGDDLRGTISSDLGFSADDRHRHGVRVGYVAELLSRHRVLTLVPVIAPYARTREAVRAHHERQGTPFLEVHVNTPLTECARRDPKGLYARAEAGEINGLTGVGDTYEVPAEPDLRVDTSVVTPRQAAETVITLLHRRGLLSTMHPPSAVDLRQ